MQREEGVELKRDEVHEEPPEENFRAQRRRAFRCGSALLGEEPLRSLTDAPGDAGEACGVAVSRDDALRRREVERLTCRHKRLVGGKVLRRFCERDGHAAPDGIEDHEPRRLVVRIRKDRCGRGEGGRRSVKHQEPGLLILACGAEPEEEVHGGL